MNRVFMTNLLFYNLTFDTFFFLWKNYTKIFLLPFPKRQILDSSKPKEFADDNFKFDKNDKKFSKPAEKSVGKGEIARYEQFLLFPR